MSHINVKNSIKQNIIKSENNILNNSKNNNQRERTSISTLELQNNLSVQKQNNHKPKKSNIVDFNDNNSISNDSERSEYENILKYCNYDLNIKNMFTDRELVTLFNEMKGGNLDNDILNIKQSNSQDENEMKNSSISNKSNEHIKNIQSALLGRNQFILRLIKYAKKHFKKSKEKTLAKAFGWLSIILNDILSSNSKLEVYKFLSNNKFKNSNNEGNDIANNFIQQFSELNNNPLLENVVIREFRSESNDKSANSSRLSKGTFPKTIHMNMNKSKSEDRKSIEINVNDFIEKDIPKLSKDFDRNNKSNKKASILSKNKKKVSDKHIKFNSNKLSSISLIQLQKEKYLFSNNDIKLNDLSDSDDSYNISSNDKSGLNNNFSTSFLNPAIPDYEIIKYNENHLALMETINFDIFLLEKEVGQRHILPTIAVYILQTNGYYNIIDPDNFDNFIYAIVDGYDRKNPYHHVSINKF